MSDMKNVKIKNHSEDINDKLIEKLDYHGKIPRPCFSCEYQDRGYISYPCWFCKLYEEYNFYKANLK